MRTSSDQYAALPNDSVAMRPAGCSIDARDHERGARGPMHPRSRTASIHLEQVDRAGAAADDAIERAGHVAGDPVGAREMASGFPIGMTPSGTPVPASSCATILTVPSRHQPPPRRPAAAQRPCACARPPPLRGQDLRCRCRCSILSHNDDRAHVSVGLRQSSRRTRRAFGSLRPAPPQYGAGGVGRCDAGHRASARAPTQVVMRETRAGQFMLRRRPLPAIAVRWMDARTTLGHARSAPPLQRMKQAATRTLPRG